MFKIKNFTPVMDSMVLIYGPTRALIFGSVWRYCQMSPKNECTAAIEKIARRVAVSPRTALRHIKLLCDDKYLEDLTPELRNKPHTYRDTGKVLMEMGMTESHSDYDRESYRGMTESHSHYDRESLEETSKKLLKKKEETPPPHYSKDAKNNNIDHNLLKDFVPELQKLVGWYPPITGIDLTPYQEKRLSELSRWLIIEAHATIKQVKKMRDFYSWMQAPPRMSQIKQDWARFKTSLTKEISPNGTQHKKTTLSEEEKFAYDQLIQTTGQ